MAWSGEWGALALAAFGPEKRPVRGTRPKAGTGHVRSVPASPPVQAGRAATILHRLPQVSLVRIALAHLPAAVRPLIVKHRELVKFSLVGATCFLLTAAVNYTLRLTVLTHKPTTALTIATTLATIVSYLLNSGWSFRSRGGRARRHEVVLFTLVSVLAIGVNVVPLYLARYVFDLQVPHVSRYTQECSDFVAGMLIGTALAMFFRWWALKKWVFPVRRTTTAHPRAATDGTPPVLGNEVGPEPVRGRHSQTLASGAGTRP